METIYRYLNSINFHKCYNELLQGSNKYHQDCSPLSKIVRETIQKELNNFFAPIRTSSVKKIYVLYHAECKDIEINAVGISNPRKIQKYMYLYIPLITAAISRIIKINKSNRDWNLMVFTDIDSKEKINTFLRTAYPSAIENISLVDISNEQTNYPMWLRFHLIRFSVRTLAEKHRSKAEVYCIDSDYLPAYSLNRLSPYFNDSEIVFTTNRDSYPLWQINEGVYSLKANSKTSYFLDYCAFIFDFICSDSIVIESWKNPKIWRGAQAALMLSTFKFNAVHTCQESCKIKLNLDRDDIYIRRHSGSTLNSPPCKLFKQKYWDLRVAKGYHFTGNHKHNPLLTEFLEYCQNPELT